MADLGDLTDFMKEGSGVSNLNWLDVNEEAYREMEPVPQQNLDIAPDLLALWRHQDEPASNFVPNTGAPRTMGDLSELHGPLRTASSDIVRTARLAIMQSTDPQKIRSVLSSRYDMTALEASKGDLATVFMERGLLGRLYIEASDFPDCSTGSKAASEFVRRYAFESKYVVAKTACGDCRHRQVMTGGASHCGVFKKEIRVEVPYSDGLASAVERQQQAKGLVVQASTGSPRERIQRAFLAEAQKAANGFSGHQQYVPPQEQVDAHQVLIAASNLTKKRDAADRQKLAAFKARPIVALLRREMLKGRSESELGQALRLAFDLRDLEETKAEWAPIFREAGLYGAVYSTQDSFDDCREGADLLNKHASKVRAIVAGDKCGSCIFNQVNRCMMYGRKLVASADEVLTAETVAAVIDEGRIAGKLPYEASRMNWGTTPAESLKALHKAASAPLGPTTATLRSSIETAFHGNPQVSQTSYLTKRDIVKTASQYMNEGLYGEDLLQALRGRFALVDIKAASADLKVILAEQGLQGIKYIDPTVYDDYGAGCKQAASQHRSRTAVQYLKVGGKCASCVHQTRVGYCSVINKQLVVEPPYVDKLAEQRAVLASGRSTEVSYESLMNNGLSMMQEYQLQHHEATIDLNTPTISIEASIEFGPQQVKL
jgi:hypothetical protein